VIDSFTKKERYRVLSSSESQNAKAIAAKIGVSLTLYLGLISPCIEYGSAAALLLP
jgi:hypothetical protein